jgi:hypothetical protein
MGLEFEATGSISFEPGPYEGHLIKMEKRNKKFTKTEEDGGQVEEDRTFVIWNFGIDEEGFEDVTLTAISSASFGPKSKARAWANSILRRKLEDGEKVREEDLKGKPVILTVENEETERGTFAKVTGLAPVRSKKKPAKNGNNSDTVDLTEEELADMEKAFPAKEAAK